MRVLAIAQSLTERAGKAAPCRKALAGLICEPCADSGIIGGGARIGLGGQRPARSRADMAMRADFVEHGGVVVRVDYDGDIGVVLGRGADHGRAADVDVLDAGGEIRAPRDRLLERVEIDGEQVDRRDAVRLHRLCVLRVVTHAEQTAMNQRMQRLHAPVHDLGKAGDITDIAHRDPRFAQQLRAAAGGDDLRAGPGERAGEVGGACFVRHGDQGTADRKFALGHSCSPAHDCLAGASAISRRMSGPAPAQRWSS